MKYPLIATHLLAQFTFPASPLAILIAVFLLFRLCLDVPVFSRKAKRLVRWIKKNFQ
jgi:hypothetical protein